MKPFMGHYVGWRTTRINKIIELFGKEFFDGKTLLELGCGYGDIGMFFQSLGAKITLAEGRQEHVDEIKRRHKNIEVICLDQNKPWDLNRKFDIIIHSGVLYHLEHWKKDLECVLNHSNLLILESEVANRSSDKFELLHIEQGHDQAISGQAIRTSAAYIEKELTKLGATFIRYDDSDLNYTDNSKKRKKGYVWHMYDWKVDNNGREWFRGQRRFWVVRKPQ